MHDFSREGSAANYSCWVGHRPRRDVGKGLQQGIVYKQEPVQGASVISETMITSGNDDDAPKSVH